MTTPTKTVTVKVPKDVQPDEDGHVHVNVGFGPTAIKITDGSAHVPRELVDTFLGVFPGSEISGGTTTADKS